MIRQQDDVGAPFPQGRDMNREDIEAVIKILAEFSGPHVFFQVATGCGDDPDIDRERFVAPDPFESAFLKDAEEADLDRKGDVADFVKKERAAIGQFKPAFALLGGARKRPFFMTKEFAFNQIFGQGGAVDGDARLPTPGTGEVDGPGYQLFARAGFAADENRGGTVGDLGDLVIDGLHAGAIADDVSGPVAVAELASQALVFGQKTIAFLQLVANGGDRFREQVGDQSEEGEVAIERGLVGGGQVDTHGSDDHATVENGDANEGGALGAPGFGPVEKRRVVADIGDDNGLAGLGDAAGDAFPDAILSAADFLAGQATGSLDAQDVGIRSTQGQGPHGEPDFSFENVEDFMEQGGNIMLVRDGLRYLVKHVEFGIGAFFHGKAS